MATVTLTEAATSKFVQTGAVSNNIKVHYNEAGSGHPVIFLHGSGPGASSWSNFARNVGPFSEKYRAILMDQPGYNKTDVRVINEGETRSQVNGNSVVGLMDALGIEKASLVGNSMGGATALNVAVDFPDRIEKLVLMGSGSGGGANIFNQQPTEGSKVLNEVFDDPSVEGFRKLINIMLYDGSTVSDEILEQRYQSTVGNMAHVEARAKSSNASRDISSLLGNITAPTLIIHGFNDRVVPFENSLRLLAAITTSKLIAFQKCGHWAQFEHAGEFNRLVLDFLDND
ncbi:MAG: hypothetical protein CL776_01265 [Chloroflexi bacterium]|nr:hypothetical protein [Chloroflexota bacterium]MBT17936.1 hypothetical protein [Dehalococcoidia bacterium]|tara:strand:- start:289 stop:1146 length:858 start_codon:yes stop_codon:yes gene_type:complete